MSVSVRELPVEEWGKLEGYPIATNGLPDPDRCAVLVAEEDGKIVGTWGVVFAPFLEGLWVDADYRQRTFTAAKMLIGMKHMLEDKKIPQALTLVQTPYVLELAQKAGFQVLDGDLCMINIPVEDNI